VRSRTGARDAFHLVIPSMPGHGFSPEPTTLGWDPTRISKAWLVLITVQRPVVYATQGPWNSAALSEKVANPAWQSKPSWLIVDANDRMVPQYERDSGKYICSRCLVA
jgi:hypothetical protein